MCRETAVYARDARIICEGLEGEEAASCYATFGCDVDRVQQYFATVESFEESFRHPGERGCAFEHRWLNGASPKSGSSVGRLGRPFTSEVVSEWLDERTCKDQGPVYHLPGLLLPSSLKPSPLGPFSAEDLEDDDDYLDAEVFNWGSFWARLLKL
jgi:hypothetical protein